MDANELEKSYQEVMLGRDEPQVMYILGSTLKEWSVLFDSEGKPVAETTDGFPIEDDEFFMVTPQGIWKVE